MPSTSGKICRWGILGAANIARKNWLSIRNAGNSVLNAVASRSPERARQFISDCQTACPHPHVPRATTYEELIAAPDVDAVYIPLPTGLRKEWVIRAAEAGKHVLVEKPVGVSVADVREMIDACRRHNVQLMDGVMFMHSSRLTRLREVLDNGETVGQLRRIATQFSFSGPEEFARENIRVSSHLEPAGCLGDLGWYNIRFTLWVLKYQMPERVTGRLLAQHGRADSPNPVPMEFSGELFFPGGVSASFYCSFITENQQWANVSGTKGFVTVRDFVLPFYGCEAMFTATKAVFRATGCDFNMEDHTRQFAVHEYSNSAANSQETMLFRNFATLVLGGRPDYAWADIALKTQIVMDACWESSRQEGRPVVIQG